MLRIRERSSRRNGVDNMNDYLRGQINTYCELVRTGKPAAIIPVQDRYINDAIEMVGCDNLSYYVESLSEGWNTLWIYKDSYIIEVIKEMPEKPKTTYDHWVLGKVFGYSDNAIKTFLETIQL